MSAEASAFASFEQKWFAAHPEHEIASAFLPPARRRAENAFGCLVYELDEVAAQIPEPQVAAAKLAWWRDELSAAAGGRASHPVTRALFAAMPAAESTRTLWPALAEAALARLALPPAATLDELLGAHAGFHRAVVRADATLDRHNARDVDAAAILWTVSGLLRGLPRIGGDSETLPLPLDLLARHGLTRSGLLAAGVRRTALLRDFLAALAAAMPRDRGRNLHQRTRSRLDLALIAGARGAAEPLQHLVAHARAGRWRSVWAAWREARALQARLPTAPVKTS